MIDHELRAYIEQEILPRYRDFDAAHREDHVRWVMEESLRFATYYHLDERLVYVAAAFHDLGLKFGREFHHLHSGKIIASDPQLPRWLTAEEIEIVRQAVEDHRASAVQAPRTIYGAIVAEADRVIDPEITLRRTVQYGLKHYPELDHAGHFVRFRKHLTEKYGEGGYLKLYIKESANRGRLIELRRIMADEQELQRRFNQLWTEEMESSNN